MNEFQKEIAERLEQCSLFQRGHYSCWKSWGQEHKNVQFKIKGTEIVVLITEDKMLFYSLEDLRRRPLPNKKLYQLINNKYIVEKDKKGNIVWPVFKDFEDVFDEVDSEVVEDIILNMDAFVNINGA